MWLFALPYTGITHDGLLYTAQALNRLYPDIYGQDVFFRYGSQDDYTLFSPFYAWAISGLGIEPAALVLTAIGKLAWFAALVWLARGVLPGVWALVGIALVVALSPFYDNDLIFSYGESFVTPRPYAEAFGMLALGLAARGRSLAAVAATLPALLLHPLMGLPVLMVTGLLWVKRLRTQIALVSLSLAAAVLMMLLSGEESGHILFKRISQDWFEIVDGRTPEVFLHNWTELGLTRVAWVGALWWTALYFGKDFEKRWGKALLLTLGSAFLLVWLAGSVFQHAFVSQLQLWRVLWVGQLLGLLMLARLLPQLWADGLFSRLQGGVLIIALLLTGFPQMILVVAASVLIFFLHRHFPDWRPTRLQYALMGMLVLLALNSKLQEMSYTANFVLPANGNPAWTLPLKEPLLLMPLALALIFWGRRSEAGLRVAFSLGAALLMFGLVVWGYGYRNHSQVSQENMALIEHARSKIPPAAVVFWQDGLQQTWLLLQRAHYASHRQNAGALISKESALEASRRMQRLLHAGFSEGEPKKRENLLKQAKEHTMEDVRYLCADRSLDFVILNEKIAHSVYFEFKLRRPGPAKLKQPYIWNYVYQCENLRGANLSGT